jgi:hypothetical protein
MGLEHGRLLQVSWKWMTMMRVTTVVRSAQDGTSSGAAVMCRRWNRTDKKDNHQIIENNSILNCSMSQFYLRYKSG